MPRWNYVAKKKKPKTSSFEIQEERIDRALTMIKVKDEISEFNLQKILEWGPGTYERVMRVIKNNYQDKVEWNKKTRIWKNISNPKQEITTLEEIPTKTELSDNELNIFCTIKQESLRPDNLI